MYFLERLILFFIFIFFVITLIKLYNKYYYYTEYFSTNEACTILSSLGEFDILNHLYSINNNSKQYLKLKSNFDILLCKCDEDTHWSIQKANDTNYINSFTNEHHFQPNASY